MAGSRSIQLDTQNVEVTFFVRWFGIIPVTGRFGALHGVVSFADFDLQASAVTIDIDTDSIQTGIGLRDRHLRGARFLDSARFPCISFRSSRIARDNGALSVEGTISLRGVEQALSINCSVDNKQNAREPTVIISTQFTLNRGMFGVGKPGGLLAYSPLFGAISDDIHVSVRMSVPALSEVPSAQPVLGR